MTKSDTRFQGIIDTIMESMPDIMLHQHTLDELFRYMASLVDVVQIVKHVNPMGELIIQFNRVEGAVSNGQDFGQSEALLDQLFPAIQAATRDQRIRAGARVDKMPSLTIEEMAHDFKVHKGELVIDPYHRPLPGSIGTTKATLIFKSTPRSIMGYLDYEVTFWKHYDSERPTVMGLCAGSMDEAVAIVRRNNPHAIITQIRLEQHG